MSASTKRPRLKLHLLGNDSQRKCKEMMERPVKVLQIGEGNFLRGFADWMLHESARQGKFHGSVAVTQPRPGGKAKLEQIRDQDGLYTMITRGLSDGKRVERTEMVSVFSQYINPYEEWQTFLELAELPSLEFVISNTTESGLKYFASDYVPGEPVQSFPGKLTVFLHQRYVRFGGDPTRGLIHLPCELLEGNGDVLRSCVLRHSEDFGYSDSFRSWIEHHNLFLNNLVDRIVTGAPTQKEAEELADRWGYEDQLINTAEPYHFWAIQGEESLDKRLPLKQAGLNVHWVKDLKPYQLRKVRILNGSHTLMSSLGLLRGKQHVRETMEDPQFSSWIREAVLEEIVPALDMPELGLEQYAEEVFERFLNPYIDHKLQDIALNTVGKIKVRVLPTLLAYEQNQGSWPERLVQGLSGFLYLYRPIQTEDGYKARLLNGEMISLRDDPDVLKALAAHWNGYDSLSGTATTELENRVAAVLSDAGVWGENLNEKEGLRAALVHEIGKLEGEAK
ncbi:tagaturonate reductase [Paenibacillus barcinonensis]|uniref:Tagaturonate reductase n=1 Tax=Paenibacillus barcinonensis TaxID=198119 RepID=A0A2V4VEU8_PAEBA|nr:tagaturonate reductase [Paenibacillus barcinonensis]PYE52266.1 tagaturonate reductase [Paenibacillus barcinonensis]QKS59606.1 tagaturonate reductase [Paenibacillus barcinonensis]